jgi:hypothetical protein
MRLPKQFHNSERPKYSESAWEKAFFVEILNFFSKFRPKCQLFPKLMSPCQGADMVTWPALIKFEITKVLRAVHTCFDAVTAGTGPRARQAAKQSGRIFNEGGETAGSGS